MAKSKGINLYEEIKKDLLSDREFMKNMLQQQLQQMHNAEFDEFMKVARYERSENRHNYRNGSYSRTLYVRAGKLELRICRDREGEFSAELFSRYQRHEKALCSALVEMYIKGVSTRKVNDIVEKLFGYGISKSTVSKLVTQLDESVQQWRARPLTHAYPYLIIDARYNKIRRDNAVISQALAIVIGIDSDGRREILSVDTGDSESETFWQETFSRLKERGLTGVRYIVSDNNQGLINAISRSFQGVIWQRCQVHFMRNFLSKLPNENARKKYVPILSDVFNAPTLEQARHRLRALLAELHIKYRSIAFWLESEIEECFNVYNLPAEHRKRMRSTNSIERFNQELKRRTQIVRIFPNEASLLRLATALCMEQSEEWQTGVRYLDMSLIKDLVLVQTNESEETAYAQ